MRVERVTSRLSVILAVYIACSGRVPIHVGTEANSLLSCRCSRCAPYIRPTFSPSDRNGLTGHPGQPFLTKGLENGFPSCPPSRRLRAVNRSSAVWDRASAVSSAMLAASKNLVYWLRCVCSQGSSSAAFQCLLQLTIIANPSRAEIRQQQPPANWWYFIASSSFQDESADAARTIFHPAPISTTKSLIEP